MATVAGPEAARENRISGQKGKRPFVQTEEDEEWKDFGMADSF